MKLTEFDAPDKNGRPVVKSWGFHRMIAAGVDGRFQFTGLPAGRHEICGFGNTRLQLASCGWIPTGVVKLTDGQALTGIERKVLAGRVIAFRIVDRQNQISTPDEKGNVRDWENDFISAWWTQMETSGATYVRKRTGAYF